MKLFSKLNSNEYNNKLEKILEDKAFDYEVKNLLLSMLYKIEIGYNDYTNVKPNSPKKEEFIENILKIIEKQCYIVEIVTPETERAKPLEEEKEVCKIDSEKGSILVYANELDLLYSIIKMGIIKKENKIAKEKTYYENAIKQFILKAKCINYTEIVRDFDGWSWNNNIKQQINLEYNLIFQNILGLNINIENNNFYNKNYLQTINQPCKFEKLLYTLILSTVSRDDGNIKQEIFKNLEEKKQEYDLMNDRTKFLNKITQDKKEIAEQIGRIDSIINDKEKLKQEYIQRNSKLKNEEKIFSISYLADILEKERNESLNDLKIKNTILQPKIYIKQKEILKNEIKFLEKVRENIENQESQKNDLIELQKEYLKAYKEVIQNLQEKEHLEKVLYQFRYYCVIPLDEKNHIYDLKQIEEQIKNIINIIIDKCIDKQIITNFSNSKSLCYNILKNIFTIKTVELDEVQIKISKKKEEKKSQKSKDYIKINIYDLKEVEKTYVEEVNNLEALNIKLDKKVQLMI